MTLLGLTKDKDILMVQAYLLLKKRGIYISKVAYIKTDHIKQAEEINKFWISNNVTIETGFIQSQGIVKNENDYTILEEEVFQFYVKNSIANEIYVYVGGGHTLLNVALQKAAYLFGANDTFQMLINVPRGEEPSTTLEVEEKIKGNQIVYASIGFEAGWNALKNLKYGDNISQTIKSIKSAIEQRNVSDINEYPFECINLLPSTAIEWLYRPIENGDREWILNLPKIDLHCHLGGFATSGKDLEIVRAAADDSVRIKDKIELEMPHNWPLPNENCSLDKYLSLGDNNGSYLLKNTGCLVNKYGMFRLVMASISKFILGYAIFITLVSDATSSLCILPSRWMTNDEPFSNFLFNISSKNCAIYSSFKFSDNSV